MLGAKRVELRMLPMSWGSTRSASENNPIRLEVMLTARLEQLNDRPDSNVLERCVRVGQETVQVAVHAAVRLVPAIVEGRVII